MKRTFLYSLLCLLLFSLTVGCAAPKSYRAHPELESIVKDINDPGLVPPDIKIYELSAGGVPELRDDWVASGTENVTRAIQDHLEFKGTGIKLIEISDEMQEEMEDIQALYRAVSTSILRHAYPGPSLFPEKQKNFDYSVGPLDEVLEDLGADSLLIVYGSDQISTTGRKVLMVLASALTGQDMITASSGLTVLSAALVGPSGRILWFDIKGGRGSFDLRDPGSASSIVGNVLYGFPALGK